MRKLRNAAQTLETGDAAVGSSVGGSGTVVGVSRPLNLLRESTAAPVPRGSERLKVGAKFHIAFAYSFFFSFFSTRSIHTSRGVESFTKP